MWRGRVTDVVISVSRAQEWPREKAAGLLSMNAVNRFWEFGGSHRYDDVDREIKDERLLRVYRKLTHVESF